MKKFVSIIVALCMLCGMTGALAGCSDPERTITVLLLANANETEFYEEYAETMLKQFQSEGYDIKKIKVDGQQEADYYHTLKAAINRGEAPDIFYIRPNEIFQYKDHIVSLQDYADEYGVGDEKSYADLGEIYDTALDMYRYNPETGELGNPEDDLYAFPKDLSVQQLGYNKTLLESYRAEITALNYSGGGKMKMPWEMNFDTQNYTWEDYKNICKAIADKGVEQVYASDVPSIEVLTRSYGGELITFTNNDRSTGAVSDVSDATSPVGKAIKYQAELVDCGAADYTNATYANFGAGKVCFYGLVASWEIAEYNQQLGKDNWGVMPWPTVDGSTNWSGLITSAGYVVSKQCASMAKGDLAKRLAISFMSPATQELMVKDKQISLPLRETVKDDYVSEANNTIYSPSTRWVYLDVISGEHGYFPAAYSTYDSVWLDELSTDLEIMWNEGKGKAVAKYNTTDWNKTYSDMQAQYDSTKFN